MSPEGEALVLFAVAVFLTLSVVIFALPIFAFWGEHSDDEDNE